MSQNNTQLKIGILIPTTSNKRDWETPEETYLYNMTFKTFGKTYSPEYKYVFYIGIDRGDKVFDKESTQGFFKNLVNTDEFNNCEIKFIYMDDIQKGYLSKMWNKLFKIAYEEGCDYFFQCGDDIAFKTVGWVKECVDTLQKHKNIGVTGPINNNLYILTQTFVHRTHMEIFGFYFPEDIINWYIDNWINMVYKTMFYYPLKHHYCENCGGEERYDIKNQLSENDTIRYNSYTYENKVRVIVKRERKRLIKCLKGIKL